MENTIERLSRQLLESNDEIDRRMAANDLAREAKWDNVIVSALVHGLTDVNPGVRDACAYVLSSPPYPAIPVVASEVAVLIEHTDIVIRNLAGSVLLKLGNPAAEAVRPYCLHHNRDIRKFAVDIIGLVGSVEDAEVLTSLIADFDVNVRSGAVEAVGNLRLHGIADVLIDAYKTTEDLRIAILEALGKIGGAVAEQFLTERLSVEQDFYVRAVSIEALAVCGSDMTIALRLYDILPDSPAELAGVLLKTIMAISHRCNEHIVLFGELRDIAHDAMKDTDIDVNNAGLLALGNDYFLSDIPLLAIELQKNNPKTRRYIVQNILQSKYPEVASSLIHHIINQESMVSELILELLGEIHLSWKHANLEQSSAVLLCLLEEFRIQSPQISQHIIDFCIIIDRIVSVGYISDLLIDGNEVEIVRSMEAIARNTLIELRDNIDYLSNTKPEYTVLANETLRELR